MIGLPGTELKKLLAKMDIHPLPDCPCLEHMLQMDEWGPVGCRANRAQIVQWLEEGAVRYGWRGVIRYVAMGLMDGLAFKLNPRDIYGSLVDLAIANSEKVHRQEVGLVG